MAGQSPASVSASKGPALIPLGHHTGKPPIPLHRPVTVIGSRSNARIHLTSSSVSKAHALVVKDGPQVYIRDLASRTHVYVNGDKVREHILENGDLIKIGSFTFKFKAGQTLSDPDDRATSAPPAKLDVTGADYPVPIDERVLLIGRRASCDVHLLEESCSTAHAVIFEMNGHRHVRDLGSRTGTYVNGVAVHQHQLNPGDNVRIGETTLTYTPSADLAVAEAGASAAGSVLDREVVDDTARAHDDAEAVEEADVVDTGVTASASAENELDALSLSEADENLSPAEEVAETASTDVQPDVAAEAEENLSPRRGWRPAAGAPVEEIADDGITSTATPAAAEVEPEQPQATQQQDDDLLRFSPTTTSSDNSDDFAADTSDHGTGAAVLDVDEPQITAGQFTDSSDKSADDQAVDDLLELAGEEIDEQREARKPIEIDLSDVAPPASARDTRETEPASLDALDFSTLEGDSAASDVIEPLDVEIDSPARPASSAPGMRFDREEPKISPVEETLDEAIPVEEETPAPAAEVAPVDAPVKPKRGRKGKKAEAEPNKPERVAASRTRRKPKEPVAEQPPAEQVVEPVEVVPQLEAPKVEPVVAIEPVESLGALDPVATDEVISATEPTPESALDLESATSGAAFDEAAIEQALGEPTTSVDPLSDTGLTRAVHDLTGDAGEIVDEPTSTSAPEPTPAPEAKAPVAPPTPPVPPAAQPAQPPSYRVGANQENFLGGVPVVLPPLDPSSRRPMAPPSIPVPPPPSRAAEPAIDELLVDDATSETGQQIDEVNALIDEILAPTGMAEGDVATKDDLLAQPTATPVDETAASEQEAISTTEEEGQDLLNDAPPPLPMPMPDEPPANSVAAKLVDPSAGPTQSRPVIPIPPPPLRGRRPARRERPGEKAAERSGPRGGQVVAPGLREDERIPPYSGAGSPTQGRVTNFDGLAMPPVREADVFSQMSPPATTTGEDPFGGATGAASPNALTPMDMVQAEEAAMPPRLRRAPAGGRASVPRDLFFGGTQPGGANAAVAPVVPGPIEDQLSGGAHRRRPPVRPAIPATMNRAATAAATANEIANAEDDHSAAIAAVTAPRRAPVIMGEEDPDVAANARSKRNRTLVLLGILAVLMLGGALGAIWTLLVPTSVTQIAIRYRNFENLNVAEQRKFQEEQQKFLNEQAGESTRIDARRILHQSDPEIANGFLDDNEKWIDVSRGTWPENRKGVMLLTYKGKFDTGDRARMASLAQALINQSSVRRNDSENVEKKLRELEDQIARTEQDKKRLTQDIEALRIQGDSAPDTRTINQIRDEAQQLERAWENALAAVKSAEAELTRLKQDAAAQREPKPDPVAAPSNNAPAANDETLTAMEAQLADLTSKLTAAQNAKNEQAAAARRALDESLKSFEEQLGSAKGLIKDSPELSAYVTAAQRLQETTRVVIDDIIRRQEQQYGRLIDLKRTLTEKMEQRRSERLGGDPELKDLNARLATATRQLNAAKNAGMQREADDKAEEVKLLTNMIKSREEMLPQDPAMKDFADTIAQIQQIIDTVQTNVEADRKRADQLLLDAQQTFAANAAVEKLPEAQKSVAADLEKQLAAINAARQQYNQAISATAIDEDEATKQLREQATAIQTAMDARKKELADSANKPQSPSATPADQVKATQDLIVRKEAELTELQKTEANARLAYTNREKDYRDAQASAKAARDSLDRLTDLQRKQQEIDQTFEQKRRDFDLFKETAKRAVTPEPVSEADVSQVESSDLRITASLASFAAVFVVFGGLMMLTMHRTAGATRGMVPMGPSIDDISSAHNGSANGTGDTNAVARSNGAATGNGDGHASSHDSDDESQPATI